MRPRWVLLYRTATLRVKCEKLKCDMKFRKKFQVTSVFRGILSQLKKM